MINDPPRVMRKRAPATAICSTFPAGVLTSGFGVLGSPISLPRSARVFFATLFFVGFSFFEVDFFAFVRAGVGSIGLAFACAVFATAFGFGFSAFPFRALAQRAFCAAMIFALPAADSFRRFCGVAVFTAGPAG